MPELDPKVGEFIRIRGFIPMLPDNHPPPRNFQKRVETVLGTKDLRLHVGYTQRKGIFTPNYTSFYVVGGPRRATIIIRGKDKVIVTFDKAAAAAIFLFNATIKCPDAKAQKRLADFLLDNPNYANFDNTGHPPQPQPGG